MAIPPDSSPYGSQTVTGPGWPNVDEETLAAAAATYEALAAKITGSIVPQQQGQLMKLADQWEGAGSLAAAGEATTIIGGHEANAAHAAAIALKLRAMEATVVKAKMLANTIAQEVQHECEAHLGDALQQCPGAGAEPRQDGAVAEHRQRDGPYDRAREHPCRAPEHPVRRRRAVGARRQRGERHRGGGHETSRWRIPAGDADDQPDGVHGRHSSPADRSADGRCLSRWASSCSSCPSRCNS